MSFRTRRSVLVAALSVGLAVAGPTGAGAGTAAGTSSLAIPKLGLKVRLARSLNAGPYAYYQDADTLAIAGHRTTYTRPFARLPELRRGDVIRIDDVTFRVRRTAVVRPRETWILGYRGLVLSACHPAGSAAFRYVVFAARA